MLNDHQFFSEHPNRKVRIRRPAFREHESEFASLGPHNMERRRMIVARVPDGPYRGTLMPIPFLQFADEEIADTDEVLLPILAGIMAEARGADNDR